MKRSKTVLILPLIALTLNGCATLAGKIGIASEAYVDEQIAVMRSEMEEESTARREELDQYAEAAAKLEELIASMEQTVQTTEELKALAVVLETRLADLPKETIAQLVEILDAYLKQE